MSDSQPSSVPAQRKGKSKIAWIVGLAIVLGAGAVYVGTRTSRPANTPAETESVVSALPLDSFVVNLADPEQRAYLRVSITLALSHPLSREKEQQAAPVAQARDAILSVLSAARPEQLLQPEGKQQLKAELLRTLKERVPQIGVEDVFFTEFLVQM
jgi:flagellar FliL protein